MKKIAIVGFGRFGKVLFKLLKDDFFVSVFDSKNSKTTEDLEKIYKNEIIFFAVPISSFNNVIRVHKEYFKNHLLIDVLSVKMHPKKILERYLKGLPTQAILTHPMFGPDSSRNGFTGLPIIMDRFRTDKKNYGFWKRYFSKKGLRVIELSAKKHDQLAAESQGLTHFIGRLLEQFKFRSTIIDSLGSKKLQEVMGQTCNDSWKLFTDLQNHNPYTKKMRLRLGSAYNKLYNELLPKKISKKYTVFGIQGGKGSFNEEAVLFYIKKNHIGNYKIKYLFTSEKVLKNLHKGNIDYGLFAVQNAVGGVVEESTRAMAKYKFKIIEEFQIVIRHSLMKRKDVRITDINSIMAHSQNFRQCKNNLNNKVPHLKLISGKGDFLDTARVAQALSESRISKKTAILGPGILASIYNLEIIKKNMQDSENNLTTFFLVSR